MLYGPCAGIAAYTVVSTFCTDDLARNAKPVAIAHFERLKGLRLEINVSFSIRTAVKHPTIRRCE